MYDNREFFSDTNIGENRLHYMLLVTFLEKLGMKAAYFSIMPQKNVSDAWSTK